VNAGFPTGFAQLRPVKQESSYDLIVSALIEITPVADGVELLVGVPPLGGFAVEVGRPAELMYVNLRKLANFREFARLNLDDSDKGGWYRISDYVDWHLLLKIKAYSQYEWTDDGSSGGAGHQ
jgi:hypothetical protein